MNNGDSNNGAHHSSFFHSFLHALRFLTIIPVPGLPPFSERSVAASIPWFPAVGALIGLLLLAVGQLGAWGWDDGVRAALVVVAWGVVTSGLHLDGISDTFDGVMSWRPPERKLDIMKDSRIGAMGVLAIGAVLLLKFAFLHSAGVAWWRAVLLAPLWGRWAGVYGMYRFPAARANGLGRSYSEHVGQREFVIATAVALGLALFIGQLQGLLAGLLVWGCAHLLARWWAKDLGGLTGDTYGALIEISEVVALGVLTV